MWSKECNQTLELAKEKVVSADVQVHYDSTLPVKLAGDASTYGVGAVISHVMPDGTERPIAFALKPYQVVSATIPKLKKRG